MSDYSIPDTAKASREATRVSGAMQAGAILQRYDFASDSEGAMHRILTDDRVPLFNGADDWEYAPQNVADMFEAAIRESDDPEETEYRLRGSWALSRLTGMSFAEAYRDHEGAMRSWRNEQLQPRTWAEAVEGTWRTAWLSNDIAKKAYQLWQKGYTGTDVRTDPLYQEILALEAQMPPPDQLKRWLPTKALKALAQFIPSFSESMGAGALGGAAGAAGAAAAYGIAGGSAAVPGVLGAAVLNPVGAISLPLVATLGFALGSGFGAGKASRVLETGSTYYDLLRYQDPNTGARLNPQAALLWSGVYGGLAAATESLQMDTFFQAFPGLGRAAKQAITKAVEDSLEDKTAAAARSGVLQRALGAFVGKQATKLGGRAADIAGETAQEMLQEGLNIGAEAIARDASQRLDGTIITPMQREEIASRLKDTLVTSALGFSAMHALPATMSLFMDAGAEGSKAKRASDAYAREEAAEGPVEVKPEDMELFRKRAEEKTPEGLRLQPVEEIEGEQYVMKAGVGKERQGSVRYALEESEEGPGTVRILGMEKGTAPNVGAAILRSVAYRFPGWNIEWDPRSPSQAALKQYLIETNPRGAAAGLQGFAAPREMPGQVTTAYLKQRIRDVAPGWTDEEADFGARIFGAWGRKLGMTADELADAALAPEVFGDVMSRAAVAQGATGATAQVRIGDRFKSLLQLAPTANPSTIIHEATHAVVLFARQAAEQDQRARAFLLELESAMGVEGGDWDADFAGWTEEYRGGNRSYMEALTYGLEDYFTTGKAPRPELEPLFKKLARWVLDIYKAMKGARVQMSPEMTAYFDDLIGGEGSPFAETRQADGDLAAEAAEAEAAPRLAKEMGEASPTPPDDMMYFQKGPDAERRGAQEDLARAKDMAWAGSTPEEIEAATGWRQEADGTWTRDSKQQAKAAPLAPGAQEAIAEAAVDTAGAQTAWGAVLGQEKAYGDVPHEQLERAVPLYQGRSLDVLTSPKFKAWFGDWEHGEVVPELLDEKGEPRVLYHGTAAQFDAFDVKRARGQGEIAIFATDNPALANEFAYSEHQDAMGEGHAQVLPIYMAMKNPLVVNWWEVNHYSGYDTAGMQKIFKMAVKGGHDGIIIDGLDDGTGRPTPDGGERMIHARQYIAFYPNQVKSIFNSGAWDVWDRRLLYQADYTYKSEETVQAKMRQAMPGSQVLNLLRGAGVSEDELHWTGLDEYLKGDAKHKPEEVLEFIRANKLQIEEKPLVEPLDDHVPKGYGRAKFAFYTIPGGENYRELLFALPTKKTRRTVYNLRDGDGGIITTNPDRSIVEAARASLGIRREVEEEVVEFIPPDEARKTFHSSHWAEPNVLAHTRTNERTDAKGRKMLFLEEIQSDWHQKGRDEGYAQPAAKRFRARKGIIEGWYSQEELDAARAEGQDVRILEERNSTPGVPDAPLKGDRWWQFVFRRMLKEAAESGFEVLGWTTGEQQADRYSLAKQVDRISYAKNDDGTYRVAAIKDDSSTLLGESMAEKDLRETVGVSITEKILAGEGEPVILRTATGHQRGATISGDGLKVGGEGMRSFYDRDLPNYANKLGKKYGAKVETEGIPVGADPEAAGNKPVRVVRSRFDFWTIETEAGENVGQFDTEEAAKQRMEWLLAHQERTEEIHALPITEEMRQGLAQGITLFQGEDYARRDEALDQIQAALEKKALPYDVYLSRKSSSLYVQLTHQGEKYTIRLSDHPTPRHAVTLHGQPDLEIDYRKDLDLEALQRFLENPEHRKVYYQGGAHSFDLANLIEEGVYYQLEGLHHGAKAGFDAFDHAYMGSGEGQQVFGWGTYLTENRGVAKGQYAERLGQAPTIMVSLREKPAEVFEEGGKFFIRWGDDSKTAYDGKQEAEAALREYEALGSPRIPLEAPSAVMERLKRMITAAGPGFPVKGPEFAARLKAMYAKALDEEIADREYNDAVSGNDLAAGIRALRDDLEKTYTWEDAEIAGGRWLYKVNVETHGKKPGGNDSGIVMLTAEMLFRDEVALGSHMGDYDATDIAEFWNENMAEDDDSTVEPWKVKAMIDQIESNLADLDKGKIPAVSRKVIDDWIYAGSGIPDPDNAPPEVSAHAKAVTQEVFSIIRKIQDDPDADPDDTLAANALEAYFGGPEGEPLLFLRPNDKTPEDEIANPVDGRWIRWEKEVNSDDINTIYDYASVLAQTEQEGDEWPDEYRVTFADLLEDPDFAEGLRDRIDTVLMGVGNFEDAEFWDAPPTGKDLYRYLADVLESPKAASLFLYAAGFDGVKYPVAALSGGKGDKGFNYVVFRDKAVKIQNRVLFQSEAWHGAGADFDRFSTEYIGTGEGAQAFGWGLYFTTSEQVARHYAHKIGMDGADLSARFKSLTDEQNDRIPDWGRDRIASALKPHTPFPGMTVLEKKLAEMNDPQERALWAARTLRADFEQRIYEQEGNLGRSLQPWLIEGTIASLKEVVAAIKALEDSGDFAIAEQKPRRHLYKVLLNRGKDDVWLDWEKPLIEQHPVVQAALQGLGLKIESPDEMEARFKALEDQIRKDLSEAALQEMEESMADSAPAVPDYEIRYNEDDETWDIYLDGEYEDWADTEEAAEEKAPNVADKAYEKAFKSWQSDVHNSVNWTGIENQVDIEMNRERSESLQIGRDAYRELAFRSNDDPRDASLKLLEAGVTGVRYPAASMGIGQHSHGTNYVVFDDSLVEIEEHILYQHGEAMRTGIARDQVAMYQGNDGDEPAVDALKEIAREGAAAGETWEEFMAFCEAMYTDAERENWKMPADLPPDARRAWYKRLFEEAQTPPDQDQALAAWLASLEENDHAGLMAALKKVWTEVLLGEKLDIPPGADEDEAREWSEKKARAGEIKAQIAEPIVAAAARVGGKGIAHLMPQMRGSLMGIIRRNPEEYAAIFGEIAGDEKLRALGAAAAAEKYEDIESPKLKKGLSISQRAALATEIRDEKLAKAIRSGEVVVGEDVKGLLERAKAAIREATAKIAALEAEAKAAAVDLDDQGRALADAQGKYQATKREISKTMNRLRRFEATGGERPSLMESRRAKLEADAETLRGKLKAAGDWVTIEEDLAQAKKDEARADRTIGKMKAEGKTPGVKLLERRSEARARIRSLEAKLAAAKEYKSLPELQTYLAKTEAIAKERRKVETAQAEMKALKRLVAYRKKLEKAVMAPSSASVRIAEAKQIRQIQRVLDPKQQSPETKKMLAALQEDLARNPAMAREIPKKWLNRLGRKPISEMSLAELEETAKRVQDLRDQGKAALAQIKRDRDDEIMDAQIRIAESVMAVKGYREPAGYESERTLLEKLKGKLRDFDYAFLNMRRFANWMDGGKEDGHNVELLWHEANRHYRAEMVERARRTKRILDAFKDAGVDPDDWYQTRVEVPGAGPGRQTKMLRKSDLMALEMAFRNEDSRQAALFGCFFSAKERKSLDEDDLLFEGVERFAALRTAIDKVLTEKDKKVLEAFAADAAETAPRLAEVVARAENREMIEVEDYYPIIKQLVTGTPIDVQVAGDVLDRTAGQRRPPRNGFTKQRVSVSPKAQTQIKLDLLSTWLESIGRQEHYIATVEYGKRLDAFYLAPYVQEQIRGAFGQEGVDYVKEYLAEVKNPGELRNVSRWENSIRYLRGNLGAAYLAWKSSSVLKQLITSPWPTLPYAGPRLFTEAAKCLTNPARYLKETEELSTYLAHRTADLVLEAVKEAKAGSAGAKMLLKANQAGMKGMELADRFSVAIGWRAVYEKALVEFNGDQAKAVEKADDAIMKSQPSARGIDLAPIYRGKSESMRMLLQFTQAVNVIWQNIRYDLPSALRAHQFKTAIGIGVSYAISGILLNAATQGFGEDDEDKAKKLAFWALAQGTEAFPLIGQDLTRAVRRGITGEKEAQMGDTALPAIAEITEGMYRLAGGEIEKAAQKFYRGGGMVLGLPVSGVREFGRFVSGDPAALIGRPDKE